MSRYTPSSLTLACACGERLIRHMWCLSCPRCGVVQPNDLRRLPAGEASRALVEVR